MLDGEKNNAEKKLNCAEESRSLAVGSPERTIGQRENTRDPTTLAEVVRCLLGDRTGRAGKLLSTSIVSLARGCTLESFFERVFFPLLRFIDRAFLFLLIFFIRYFSKLSLYKSPAEAGAFSSSVGFNGFRFLTSRYRQPRRHEIGLINLETWSLIRA